MGPEHEDEEALQADALREKSMSIKLKVENTIRWRWTKDKNGQDVSQLYLSYSSLNQRHPRSAKTIK